MTALIDPTRHAAPRHRRLVDDTTDEVGVPAADGWLDPETAPLAVYRDRDLPYAPLAVQRDRARLVAVAPPVAVGTAAPPVAAVSAARAGPVPVVPAARTASASASALIDRLGRARVAAVAVLALVVVLAATAVVLLTGGPPGARPGPGVAPARSAHVLPARVS